MARRCFVIMPFSRKFDAIWQTVIRPAVESSGDVCSRADDFFTPGIVMDDVLESIKSADYVIADLTGRNPNVYYELGIAHALGKQVILTSQDLADVPFDLKHHRIIEYADSVAGAAQLRERLERFLNNV